MERAIIVISVILAVQIPLGIAAIWKVEKDQKVNRTVKWLFYSNIVLSWIFSSMPLLYSTIPEVDLVIAFLYLFNWFPVLATLVWYVY